MEPEFEDRRRAPRTQQSKLARIRPLDPSLPVEYCTTLDISQDGLYFSTSAGHYTRGMGVHVTLDFQPGNPTKLLMTGAVVRVDRLASGKFGVAIHISSSFS